MIARINRYNDRGMISAKLYLPVKAVKELELEDGGVKLEFNGKSYEVSVSKCRRGATSSKLYLPREVVRAIIEKDAEAALIEVGGRVVRVIGLIKLCKICGEATTAPDGLCLKQHFNGPNTCVRCGSMRSGGGGNGDALCDDCVSAYASLCGLMEWLRPGPRKLSFDSGEYEEA